MDQNNDAPETYVDYQTGERVPMLDFFHPDFPGHSSQKNPWERVYSKQEWAAAKRLGVAERGRYASPGPMIYGDAEQLSLRIKEDLRAAEKRVKDLELLLEAVEREGVKEFPEGSIYEQRNKS